MGLWEDRVLPRIVERACGTADVEELRPDDVVDCALSTVTLCTIRVPEAALAELARVLRPGGTLHFLEHGLAPEPSVVRWQHRLTPLQRRVGGGCHLDRSIPDVLTDGGFRIGELQQFYAAGPKAFSYFYLGSAEVASAA